MWCRTRTSTCVRGPAASSVARSGGSSARSNGARGELGRHARPTSVLGDLADRQAGRAVSRAEDLLVRAAPPSAREHGAQHLVPGDDVAQRGGQRGPVQVAVQPQHDRDVVGRRWARRAGPGTTAAAGRRTTGSSGLGTAVAAAQRGPGRARPRRPARRASPAGVGASNSGPDRDLGAQDRDGSGWPPGPRAASDRPGRRSRRPGRPGPGRAPRRTARTGSPPAGWQGRRPGRSGGAPGAGSARRSTLPLTFSGSASSTVDGGRDHVAGQRPATACADGLGQARHRRHPSAGTT